jgi:hypothetical protein
MLPLFTTFVLSTFISLIALALRLRKLSRHLADNTMPGHSNNGRARSTTGSYGSDGSWHPSTPVFVPAHLRVKSKNDEQQTNSTDDQTASKIADDNDKQLVLASTTTTNTSKDNMLQLQSYVKPVPAAVL